jgi:hypothetical protein
MEQKEFLIHIKTIFDFLQKPSVRIILFHNPYSEHQQKIIDKMCIENYRIIGQVIRKEPYTKSLEDIQQLLDSYQEPFTDLETLKFVIIGQQKP